MNQELIRIVENIARDKNIDKESIFIDLEEAMISAVRKHFGEPDADIVVQIDRSTGVFTAFKDEEQIDITKLGRIPAQTAKQVMIQKIRADERSSIYADYTERIGEIVSGAVVRYEGGSLIVNLNNRIEAFLPKAEQIMGQSHRPGERIRCIILDVKEASSQVKIILSRTHPDFIKRLFELEVPEIVENIIEIRAMAREAGYRTKVAVISLDDKVDPVGACVGVRGSRIKNIVEELGGEKIDIVRWNDSSQVLITNALMPAKVSEIALCFELSRATVVVDEDQLSLAIGKHGQNVRLAARLTGWDIDILTPDEYNQGIERLTSCVKKAEGGNDTVLDKLIALGIISVMDLDEVGTEPLIKELGIDEKLAGKLIVCAVEEAKLIAEEAKQKRAEKLLKKEKATKPDNPQEAQEETKEEETTPEEAPKEEAVAQEEIKQEEVAAEEVAPEVTPKEEIAQENDEQEVQDES
ncbi:MAG: transcription termination factor NusA [Planctomycetes bacterium]|nr:transcription termination factor NusA [Planctomycetota bacterium]MCK5473031.1 transcription termination factor NusA [Planctomycetota bacterium]